MMDESVIQWWLEQGFGLLPCQPNSKYLVKGYGAHQGQIKTLEDAVRMFAGTRLNVSVCGGKDKIILDFDDAGLYESWAKEHLDYKTSYTEISPLRKCPHVFLRGNVPQGLMLKQGVEVKRVCMVSPSVVNGRAYVRGEGEILNAEFDVFSSLSIPGTKTAYILELEQRQKSRRNPAPSKSSAVNLIKRKYTVESVFRSHGVEVPTDSKSRYVMVKCPFHNDTKPSMFLDLDLQIWKCFSCDAHGDVINAYALFRRITNMDAIREMVQGVTS